MYENLSSNAKRLSSKNISNYQELLSINCQELLSEFYYSLEIAIKNNGLKTGEMIHGGGWSESNLDNKKGSNKYIDTTLGCIRISNLDVFLIEKTLNSYLAVKKLI